MWPVNVFHGAYFLDDFPCVIASVGFAVENDVLHGFSHIAVLANTMVFIVFYFKPVLAAFMGIMDQFPNE